MILITTIVTIAILIMSVVFHELAHGYMADFLGDPTPRLQGRLSVNPLKHLELFGSVIVPIITAMSGFAFGWAKPVEWNPYNVKNRRVGELLISLAGPLANILIATVFGFVIRFGVGNVSDSFILISSYIVLVNISLAVFNFLPIPPLDGSKIFFSLLPPRLAYVRAWMERYSLVLMLVLLFGLWKFIEPIIPLLYRIIVGGML